MHAMHGTPAIRLDRLCADRGLDGTIVAKLEYLSPGYSKKDRIARQMIEDARSLRLPDSVLLRSTWS